MRRVAIILTCFNHSAYTAQALDTLFRFTRPSKQVRYQFAVFDDCSTDDTEQIVRDFSEGNVNYYRPKRNGGLTRLWNEAFRIYKHCDYIVLSNNDVIFTPNWCELLLSEMTLHGCLMAGPITNGPGHVDEQDVRKFLDDYVPSDDMGHILSTSQKLLKKKSFRITRINGFCMAFHTALLKEADSTGAGTPFDPNLRLFGSEDELQARLSPLPLIVPKCFVFHYKRVSISDRPRPFHTYRGRLS